jgi:plasmid stabilization system protein ParE
MKVEYSNRAVADLDEISARSRRMFGDRVAQALEARIRAVIDRISEDPLSAPELEQRPGVRVVPLVRYPFQNLLSRPRGPRENPAHPALRTASTGGRGLTKKTPPALYVLPHGDLASSQCRAGLKPAATRFRTSIRRRRGSRWRCVARLRATRSPWCRL